MAHYFLGRTFAYGGYTRWTIEPDKNFTVPVPEDAEIAMLSATTNCIWEKRRTAKSFTP
jgi:hypothetical protein